MTEYRKKIQTIIDGFSCGLGNDEMDAAFKEIIDWTASLERQIKGYQSLNRGIASILAECRAVEQVCGKTLGYPWYKDDQKNFPGATEESGVCVGEHVPATIAMELAREFQKVKNVEDEAKRILNESHLAGDHYAYDLMRTVLAPLGEEL